MKIYETDQIRVTSNPLFKSPQFIERGYKYIDPSIVSSKILDPVRTRINRRVYKSSTIFHWSKNLLSIKQRIKITQLYLGNLMVSLSRKPNFQNRNEYNSLSNRLLMNNYHRIGEVLALIVLLRK